MTLPYPDRAAYYDTVCPEGCGASWFAYRNMEASGQGRRYVVEAPEGRAAFQSRREARRAGQVSILRHILGKCPMNGSAQDEPTMEHPAVR